MSTILEASLRGIKENIFDPETSLRELNSIDIKKNYIFDFWIKKLLVMTPILLDRIFSVVNILKSRGFNVLEFDNTDGLILGGMKLPKNQIGSITLDNDVELVYRIFDSSKLRHLLKEYIKSGNLNETSNDIQKLVKHPEFQRSQEAFSKTFEWYVGEMMVREFAAISSSFGVKVSDIYRSSALGKEPGDFDVISVLRNLNIVYYECKTGNLKMNHIFKTVERSIAIHCEFCVIILNEIRERNIQQMLKNQNYPLVNINTLSKVTLRVTNVSILMWMNCYFISSEKDVQSQIKIVLRINEAKKNADLYLSGYSKGIYEILGYQVDELFTNRLPV